MASFYATNYDPFGSLTRGIERGLGLGTGLEDIAQARQDRERRRRLLDLQIGQAEQAAQDLQALPEAQQTLLEAIRPQLTPEGAQEFFGGAPGTGIDLAQIAPLMRRKRTVQEIIGTPERMKAFGLVSRRAPGFLNLLSLSTPEAVAKEEQTKQRREEADQLFTQSIEDFATPGRQGEGLGKFTKAMILSGKPPSVEALMSYSGDKEDHKTFDQEAPQLGKYLIEALQGDEQAALNFAGSIFTVKSKTARALLSQYKNDVQAVLGTKIPAAVMRGWERYAQLRTVHADPKKAWEALSQEDPGATVQMQKAGLLPLEFKAAIEAEALEKRAVAGERARLGERGKEAQKTRETALRMLKEGKSDAEIYAATGLDAEQVRTGVKGRPEANIKTLEAQAIRVAQKTFPSDPIKQRAFAERLHKRLSFLSEQMTFAEIEKAIQDEIAVATGAAPLPEPAQKEATGFLTSIKQFFTRRPAPGRGRRPAAATREIINRTLQETGGDKDRARKLLEQRGYDLSIEVTE